MFDLHFHIVPPSLLSRVVIHNNLGPPYTVRTDVVYPVEESPASGGKPPGYSLSRYPPVNLQEQECIFWQNTLFLDDRGETTLIVEPDSANWMILGGHYLRLFNSMKTPIPFGYALCNYYLSKENTRNFISYCLLHNFLRAENYATIFEPPAATPLSYVDRSVIEISRWSQASGENGTERIGTDVVREIMRSLVKNARSGMKGLARGPLWIELVSIEPGRERELISIIISESRVEQEFKNVAFLLHTQCDRIDAAISSFLEWNGVMVRGYVNLASELESEPSLTGLRLLNSAGILESLCITISRPYDFMCLESILTGTRLPQEIREIRLRLLPPESGSNSDIALKGMAYAMAGQCLTMLEKIAQCFCDEGRGRFQTYPCIFPISQLLHNLVSSERSTSCSKNRPSGRTLFMDWDGKASPCSCGERYEICKVCQWRNFCPGLCQGLREGGDDAEKTLYCNFLKRLIPELMLRVDENRELLRLASFD